MQRRNTNTRFLLAIVLVPIAALAFGTGSALACGGAFGEEFVLEPDQTIVIDHASGVETYVFNPSFCGAAADFGLILPVPATLEANPSLEDSGIYWDLDLFTQPEIRYNDVCRPRLTSDAWVGNDAGYQGDMSNSVDVIDTGTVGQFDWTLLQADTATAFTDWLDANAYPYDAATADIFTHYVDAGWYFVAFKVTAKAEAPPPGSTICGELGPLSLSFASEQPVIPARIAMVGNSYQTWRTFIIAETEMHWPDGYATREFAGPLGDLQGFDDLAAFAPTGDYLTELELQLHSMVEDVVLEPTTESPYRRVEYRDKYIDCPGDDIGGVDVVGVDFGSMEAHDYIEDPAADGDPDGEDDCGCSLARASELPLGSAGLLVLLGLFWVRRRS